MTDIKSVSRFVAPIAQKYGAERVALSGNRGNIKRVVTNAALKWK